MKPTFGSRLGGSATAAILILAWTGLGKQTRPEHPMPSPRALVFGNLENLSPTLLQDDKHGGTEDGKASVDVGGTWRGKS